METLNIFQSQVETCQESALQVNHKHAMECRNVEDLISMSVAIFNSVKQSAVRWQHRAAGLSTDEQLAEIRRFVELYQMIQKLFDIVLKRADATVRKGYDIDGLAEIKKANRQLEGILTISPERMIASVEQLRQGLARPISEVMGGVRDRHHAGSR